MPVYEEKDECDEQVRKDAERDPSDIAAEELKKHALLWELINGTPLTDNESQSPKYTGCPQCDDEYRHIEEKAEEDVRETAQDPK
jgi:hypothetical protein